MLNKKYQSTNNALASYDYYDIAEGTGTKIFYGYVTSGASAISYGLTGDSSIYSNQIDLFNSGSLFGIINVNFDLPAFNLPKTIGGTGLINGVMQVLPFVGSLCSGSFMVYVNKISSGVTTTLVSGTTQLLTKNGGGGLNDFIVLPLTIPQTSFKRGDVLRLNMSGANYKDAGAGGPSGVGIALGSDPMNRDGIYIKPSSDTNPQTTTRLKFHCPFVLDL